MNLVLFFYSLIYLTGQLSGIYIGDGKTVYLGDLIIIIIAFSLIIRKNGLKMIQKSKLLRPISWFVLASIISLIVNFYRYDSNEIAGGVMYLVRWIFYSGLYFAVATSYFKKDLVVKWLYFIPLILAILGIFQLVLYPNLRNILYMGWDPHFMRLTSTLLDPNFMGFILVAGFIFGLTQFGDINKYILIFGQVIFLTALAATYSRSSFLAFVIGIVIYSLLNKRFFYLIFLILMGFIYLIIPKSGLDVTSLWRTTSSVSRLESAREALEFFKASPIFGYGFNTFRYLSNPFNQEINRIIPRAGAGIDASLLFVLSASGIIGLLTYLNLLKSQLDMGLLNLKSKYSKAFISIFCALTVHSFFNNSLMYLWIVSYFWIICGLLEVENTSYST
jgi:O-antigen ligase